MMERGEWPPLMVVFDPLEGYVLACYTDCIIIQQQSQFPFPREKYSDV